jgi:hypothetical protein
MSDMEQKIIFQGELQLTGWGDSSTTGPWVKFWTHPEDLERFKLLRERKGKTEGTRIACVMVEINEDETIVTQPPAPAPDPERYKPHVGPLGMLAVRWCKEPEFQAWAWAMVEGNFFDPRHRLTEDQAKTFILERAGVVEKYGQQASRKHLDADADCGESFQMNVRGPYMKHLMARGILR